jgi:hypothetical protein
MDFIQSFVNNTHPLSDNALTLLRSIFTEKSYSKNDTFVSIGETPTKFYVLKKDLFNHKSFLFLPKWI